MSALAQTATGDLLLTSGSLTLVTEKEEVKQALQDRLRVFRGECFLNAEAGTPWYQEILGKGKDPRQAEAALKAVIMGTPDVVSLLEFTFELDKGTRVASLTFKVDTTFGTVSLNEGI